MTLAEKYINEYTNITGYLLKTDKGIIKGNFLFFDKNLLLEWLGKNPYEDAITKLKMWRLARWIDTDEERLTTRIKVDGKYVRMIKINLSAYEFFNVVNDRH
jgi:hypothetical protein